VPPPEPPKREPAAVVHDRPVPPPAAPKQPALPPAVENLARWKASGQARAWVEARRGKWNHGDWLALLADLGRSPFWPMEPDAIGLVLEEYKQELLRRN
jgi:hypothetical protein